MPERAFYKILGRRGGTDARGLANVGYLYQLVGYDDSSAMQFSPEPPPVALDVDTREFNNIALGNDYIEIWCNYVGIPGSEDTPPKGKTQYMKKGRWREVPIEVFPNRNLLISKYGAYDDGSGRLKFPQYLGAVAPTLTPHLVGIGSGVFMQNGNDSSGGSQGSLNPLYGVSTYPVQVLCASKSYIRRVEPPDLFSQAGTVIKNLPDDFPNPEQGGPWLVNNPEARTRGNCVDIVETFDELDELAHLEALYDLITKKS